jgi:hypothetical protein
VQSGPSSGSRRYVHARLLLGRHETLLITWLLTPGGGTTDVDLAAQPESTRILARLTLLASRGRLRRRLKPRSTTWQ